MNETPFHLTNKTVFVTGASSGIGRQIAIAISNMGGKLVITGRNQERLNETLSLLTGIGHLSFQADFNDKKQLVDLIANLPVLDGVVMNAGVVNALPIRFLTEEKIKETFGINFESIVLLMAGISGKRKLNKESSVVFISSISSSFPPKGGAMYSSAKAAIETFSKVFALEHSHLKIRSNCILPGMVKTALYENVEKTVTKESMDAHIASYPLGVGYPEDVANTAIFLLSDASRWITGTNIILDGGCILNG
ncbi:MAG: SDR family oxidoreductase [Flavobacteriales bacterium]|nr:SDR family oxidoreductase [Flavobacteriales bacterium]